MDEQFLRALKSVDLKHPKDHAAAIRAMFAHINELDAAGLMTAMETISFFYEHMLETLDDATFGRVDQIANAIVARMVFMCSQASTDSRKSMAAAFKHSMSLDVLHFHIRAFKDAGLT